MIYHENWEQSPPSVPILFDISRVSRRLVYFLLKGTMSISWESLLQPWAAIR